MTSRRLSLLLYSNLYIYITLISMISKRGKSNTPTGIASHAHVLLARYTILHPGGGGTLKGSLCRGVPQKRCHKCRPFICSLHTLLKASGPKHTLFKTLNSKLYLCLSLKTLKTIPCSAAHTLVSLAGFFFLMSRNGTLRDIPKTAARETTHTRNRPNKERTIFF